MKRSQEGHCGPFNAPAYPPPPYEMTDRTQVLFVFFRADLEAMAFEVPEPLKLADDPMMLCWIGDMAQPPHTFHHYHEGIVAISVQYEGITGWYDGYIWTHNDEALLVGRELYGWPKQICEDTPLEFHGNQVHGKVTRGGSELMKMIFNPTSPPPSRRIVPEEEIFVRYMGDNWFGLKKIPSPEENGEVIRQLVHVQVEDAKIHEIWAGNTSLELGRSGYYPLLHKLNPTEILYAAYVRTSFILPYGKILWEERYRPTEMPQSELVGLST